MSWSFAKDYHACFLFCFPPHFVYVLQGRDLIILMAPGIIFSTLGMENKNLQLHNDYYWGVWLLGFPRGVWTS